MTLNEAKLINELISLYQQLYMKKLGRKPMVNRSKVKYRIKDMLEDMSVEDFKTLLARYVNSRRDPDLVSLCYDYVEIIEEMNVQDEDIAARKHLLKETERRVKEYRERFGQ